MVAEATPAPAVSATEARQNFQKLKTHLHRRMIDALDLSEADREKLFGGNARRLMRLGEDL